VYQPSWSGWSQYSSFNEKVTVDDELQVPQREVSSYPGFYPTHPPSPDYSLDPYRPCIRFFSPPPDGAKIKFLWSSQHIETEAEQCTEQLTPAGPGSPCTTT
jgi:hypothetical protein